MLAGAVLLVAVQFAQFLIFVLEASPSEMSGSEGHSSLTGERIQYSFYSPPTIFPSVAPVREMNLISD